MDETVPYFPYDVVRPGQRSLLRHIVKSLGTKKPMLVHAPTGLGKTVAALAPTLELALKNKLTIFFLTSRHTQHLIAIETLHAIREKHKLNFTAVPIVGKKWMCLQPGVTTLHSGEFNEFCKHLKERGQCNYYTNARVSEGKATPLSEATASKLKVISPLTTNAIVKEAEQQQLCPYELGLDVAKDAQVIITDYYYLFNQTIRERFLAKLNTTLAKSILIIDEGHNLPDRVRNLLSSTLSTTTITNAQKEAAKYGHDTLVEPLNVLQGILAALAKGVQDERGIEKGMLMKPLSEKISYVDLITTLEAAGEAVTVEQKRSSLSAIAQFLELWAGPDDGYARILNRKRTAKGDVLQLHYHCLDPSLLAAQVIEQTYWTLLMSGTLTPPEMYRDLLGFPQNAETQEYPTPFSERNRLALVVPRTTTKFTARSEEQYREMARLLQEMILCVPGNVAVFFPSYQLRDRVYAYLQTECPRTMFLEDASLTKDARVELLERFKSYKDIGAVLLGVASGSFGEGIDLPGDLLKCVIVVGLPLGKPDLQTQELIKYYDEKFGQGWNYGYVLPAFTKTLQNAGRCIRTETDRGAILFLDERYAWPQYLRCFPQDWDVTITTDFKLHLQDFFKKAP